MMFLSSRIKKVIAVVMASAIAVAGLPYDFVYANNGDESSDSDISSTGTQTEQNGKVELATGKEITSDIGYISLKADSEICSEVYANDGKNNIELPNYNLNNTDTYIAPYDFKDSLFWSFNNKDNEEVSGKSYKNYYLRIDSNDKEFGNNLTFSVSESNGTYGKNEFNFERVVEAGNSSLYKYSVLSDSEEDFDNIKNLTNGTIILKSIASGKEVYININGFKLSSMSNLCVTMDTTGKKYNITSDNENIFYFPVVFDKKISEENRDHVAAMSLNESNNVYSWTTQIYESDLKFKISSDSNDWYTGDTIKLSVDGLNKGVWKKIEPVVEYNDSGKNENYTIKDKNTLKVKLTFGKSSISLGNTVVLNDVKDGMPYVEECTAEAKGNAELNMCSFGIYSSKSIDFSVKVNDPGQKSFDDLKVCDIADKLQQTSENGEYRFEINDNYKQEKLKVLFEKDNITCKEEYIKKVNEQEYNDGCKVVVSEEKPSIEIGNTKYIKNKPLIEIPINVSSLGDGSKVSDPGLSSVEVIIKDDQKKTIKSFKESANNENIESGVNNDIILVTSKNTDSFSDKVISKKTYTLTLKIDTNNKNYLTDGIYELNVTVKNNFGNEIKKNYSFSVDREAPEITIQYFDSKGKEIKLNDDNIQWYYADEKIKVKITIKDTVAGVNTDSIKISNNSEDNNLLEYFKNTESSVLQYVLESDTIPILDVAYNLDVSVEDKLGNLAHSSNNKEFAYTQDVPSVTFEDTDNWYGKWYNEDNKDFKVKFTAKSDSKSKNADAGLRSVKAELLYIEDIAKENDEGWQTVADITDDENGISMSNETSKFADVVKLTRNEYQDKNFAQEKITECGYTLSFDFEKDNPLKSGYYKLKVTVENNVHNESQNENYGKYHSIVDTSESFGLDFDAPEISLELLNENNNKTCKLSGDDKIDVYDKSVELKVTITDRNFATDKNLFSYSITKDEKDYTKNQEITDWKSNGDTHTGTIYFDEQGVYEFHTEKLSDILSDGNGNNNENVNKISFAVDTEEPKVAIEYESNSLQKLLELVTFGFYTNDKVNVTVTVSDEIAGVSKDTVQILNTLDDENTDMKSSFECNEKSATKEYVYTLELQEDVAYKLKVTAKDNLGRDYDKENASESNLDPDMEIATTQDVPSVTFEDTDNWYGKWYNEDNKDFKVKFTAKSDSKSKNADAGLRSVKAELLYIEDIAKENDEGWQTVADITDDENGISMSNETSKFADVVKLTRNEYQDKNFAQEKITECGYTLSFDFEKDNPLKSGYYKLKVTVENNVHNESQNENYGKYHSIVNTSKSFGLDFDAPKIEWSYDNNVITNNAKNDSNDIDYYNKERTLTVKVTDHSLTADEIEDYLDYSIKDESNNKINLNWKSSTDKNNEFIAEYKFEDKKNSDKDGKFSVEFTNLTDKCGNSAETKDLSDKAEVFIIDTTAPIISWKYDNNKSTNNSINASDDLNYYNDERKLTVTVKEHNITADKINNYLAYSIKDESNNDIKLNWVQVEGKIDEYSASYTFKDLPNKDSDGRFDVLISSFADKASNKALMTDGKEFNKYEESFIIDTTAPVISWTYNNHTHNEVKNMAYYDAERTLTVNITEHNITADKINDYLAYSIKDESNNDIRLNWVQVEGKVNEYSASYTFKDLPNNGSDGRFDVVISSFADKASNKALMTDGKEFNKYEEIFIIDTTAPVISWKYDNNSKKTDGGKDYYNKVRKLTVTVTEHNITLDEIKNNDYFKYLIKDEHGKKQKLEWHSVDGANTFIGEYTFVDKSGDVNDGEYSVALNAFKDKAGNPVLNNRKEFENYNESFVIDTTAPVITYNYDNNTKQTVSGKDYYSKNRIITITVDEHTFENQSQLNDKLKYSITDEHGLSHTLNWSKTGNVYRTTYKFVDDKNDANDGAYKISISSFKDKAGNSAELKNTNNSKAKFGGYSNSFIIDTTNPSVTINYRDLNSFNKRYNGYDYYRTDSLVAEITVVEHNFNTMTGKTADYNVVEYSTVDINNKALNSVKLNNGNLSWTKSGNTYTTYVRLNGNTRYSNFSYAVIDNSGRKVEKKNNKTNFVIDNKNPNSMKINYSSNPFTTILEKLSFGCYRSSVTVTFSAMDDTAGIQRIEYSYVGLDGSRSGSGTFNFEQMNRAPSHFADGSFTIDPQFKGYIEFNVVDFSGNISTYSTSNQNYGIVVDNADPNVDKIAPVVKVNPSITPRNGIFNGDVKINVDVTDPKTNGVSSGVNRIEYVITNKTTGAVENGTITNNNKKSNVFSASFNVDSKKFNSNDVEIKVSAYDNSENRGNSSRNIKIDITAPTVSIKYQGGSANTVNGTDYYNSNRTATITVTERNFDPADVKYTIKNTDKVIPSLSQWTSSINSSNPDLTTHTAKIVYAADGDYTFDFSFEDMSGNPAAKVQTQKFTLDKTLPVIGVSYDNNSYENTNYYNSERTATISVKEHNFFAGDVKVNIYATDADNITTTAAPKVSAWSSNGDVHTATVKFSDDGKYNITVNYTDLAKNSARTFENGEFYIDKTAPQVEITGVEPNKAYGGNVRFAVNIDDINYNADYSYKIDRIDINADKKDASDLFNVSVTEDGKLISSASLKEVRSNDGIYVLSAIAKDKAGNETAKNVKFSVNRFGSTYELDNNTKKLSGNCISKEQDVVIKEVNVDPIELEEISILRGNDTIVLNKGEDYTVELSGNANTWYTAVYTIKADVFSEDGVYSIKLISGDSKLGVKNSNVDTDKSSDDSAKLVLGFVVDKTLPLVTLSGIDSDVLYEEGKRTLLINCEDSNLQVDSLIVTIGGKKYVFDKSNIEVTDSGLKLSLDLLSEEFPDYIDVEVSIADKAGNVGIASRTHFKLSASAIERFFANTPLVLISAAVLLLIIGLIIFVIVRKRKSKENRS